MVSKSALHLEVEREAGAVEAGVSRDGWAVHSKGPEEKEWLPRGRGGAGGRMGTEFGKAPKGLAVGSQGLTRVIITPLTLYGPMAVPWERPANAAVVGGGDIGVLSTCQCVSTAPAGHCGGGAQGEESSTACSNPKH